ncbi:MAG: hypothetical protein M1838_002990 [Thelocarpon superellum]|nr:MAG: hypothetical protein M1838_002990 [Thelocarpon superellum]
MSPHHLHHPAQAWSLRVPSPPRILVPPPPFTDDGDAAWDLIPRSPSSSCEGAKLGFLARVTYGSFKTSASVLDWKYESRREAQQILPFLFLGPAIAARDRKFLRQAGITMLLAVRSTMSAHANLLDGRTTAQDLGLLSEAIDVDSNPELIAIFPRAITLINAHLSDVHGRQASATGKVLVYCESGNERSAGVVAAYVMAMFDTDLIKTIQIIQAQRFCCSFDESLKTLLETFADILHARRKVMPAPTTPDRPSKRKLDVADSDVDLIIRQGEADAERFSGRQGQAPFADLAD